MDEFLPGFLRVLCFPQYKLRINLRNVPESTKLQFSKKILFIWEFDYYNLNRYKFTNHKQNNLCFCNRKTSLFIFYDIVIILNIKMEVVLIWKKA